MRQHQSNLELTYQCDAELDAPDRYREVLSLGNDRKLIAQGGGLSYAPASFGRNSMTVSMRGFDRILDFSPDQGTLEVESGITLKKLFDFLTPRGFCMLIQPGWPDLCVGALIASNVHGKNQFVDGVFSQITESLTIFHPDKGVLSCSRSENPALFDLTCGGLGLTGIILTACLKVHRLKGYAVRRELIPVRNLVETIEVIIEHRGRHDIVMSWTNLGGIPSTMGQGFIITGDIHPGGKDGRSLKYRPLNPHKKAKARVQAFRRYTMPGINWLYYLWETRKTVLDDIPLFSALFPFYNKGFYFDLFGQRGFLSQQILIPEDRIFDFLAAFESMFRPAQVPIVLAAFKAFRGEQRFLNFNGTGFSFYTDFLNTGPSRAFLQKFNDLATDFGCVSNLLRNAFLPLKVVRAQYSEFDVFRQRLNDYDPKRIFVSALSERLAL